MTPRLEQPRPGALPRPSAPRVPRWGAASLAAALAVAGVTRAAWGASTAGRLDLAPRAPVRPDPKDGPDVDVAAAIEDDEVRLTIITNLAFLDATAPVGRELPEALAGPEVDAAHEALRALFDERNQVTIDGVEVLPEASEFDVDPGDPALLPHFPRFGALAVFKTRLTLRYACKTPPRRVKFVWGVFPPNAAFEDGDPGAGTARGSDAPPIEVLCRLSAAGLSEVLRFTTREPEHTWHRPAEGTSHLAPVPALEPAAPTPIPWGHAASAAGAAALAWRGPRRLRPWCGPLAVLLTALTALRATAGSGARLPSAAEALAVFEPLHTNIYRAFDYTDEEDVYDALAASVDGALLARLYDEVYRSLVLQEEGGAVSRVERVRYVTTRVVEIGLVGGERRAGFVVDALWQVDGAVVHWGHAHARTNEYRAEYTVAAMDGGWRITSSRVIEQRRVDAAPLTGGGG